MGFSIMVLFQRQNYILVTSNGSKETQGKKVYRSTIRQLWQHGVRKNDIRNEASLRGLW
jgi:hypothetical protein